MFAAIFDGTSVLQWMRLIASVFAAGVTVKLMDDALDGDKDVRPGWAGRVGAGVVPYAVVSFALAVCLHPPAAVSLTCGAYAIGMGHELNRKMPTGMRGWHESAVVMVGAALFAGVVSALAALAVMLFVQCVDDLLDETEDKLQGHGNVAHRLGRVETKLLALSALIVSAALAARLTLAVVVCVPLLEGFFQRLHAKEEA